MAKFAVDTRLQCNMIVKVKKVSSTHTLDVSSSLYTSIVYSYNFDPGFMRVLTMEGFQLSEADRAHNLPIVRAQ
jgi:hypothetical protein